MEQKLAALLKLTSYAELEIDATRQTLAEAMSWDAKEVLKILDPHGRGGISSFEIYKFLDKHKISANQDEVKMIVDYYDVKKKGRIDLEAFRWALAPRKESKIELIRPHGPRKSEEKLVKFFIKELELLRKTYTLRMQLHGTVATHSFDFFQVLDKDGKGEINYRDIDLFLQRQGIILSDQEITAIVNRGARTRHNSMTYREFESCLVPDIINKKISTVYAEPEYLYNSIRIPYRHPDIFESHKPLRGRYKEELANTVAGNFYGSTSSAPLPYQNDYSKTAMHYTEIYARTRPVYIDRPRSESPKVYRPTNYTTIGQNYNKPYTSSLNNYAERNTRSASPKAYRPTNYNITAQNYNRPYISSFNNYAGGNTYKSDGVGYRSSFAGTTPYSPEKEKPIFNLKYTQIYPHTVAKDIESPKKEKTAFKELSYAQIYPNAVKNSTFTLPPHYSTYPYKTPFYPESYYTNYYPAISKTGSVSYPEFMYTYKSSVGADTAYKPYNSYSKLSSQMNYSSSVGKNTYKDFGYGMDSGIPQHYRSNYASLKYHTSQVKPANYYVVNKRFHDDFYMSKDSNIPRLEGMQYNAGRTQDRFAQSDTFSRADDLSKIEQIVSSNMRGSSKFLTAPKPSN